MPTAIAKKEVKVVGNVVERKWITFYRRKLTETGPTQVWDVKSQDGRDLGTIKWFGKFFKYSFFPAPDTIFEHVCLRDIADFCVLLDAKRRAENQKKKAS